MALRLSNHTHLKFPRVSSELARWKNRLSTKKEKIDFSLGDPEATYTVQLYSSSFCDSYSLGLLVEIDGVPASVWMSDWPLKKRLEKYLGNKKIQHIPVDLRAELLETTLKPLFTLIMLRTNTQIRVLNFLNLKPSDVNAFSLGMSLRDNKNNQEAKMVVLMHNKLLPVIQKVLAYWPDKTSDFWYQQKTMMWLEAGALELSLTELNNLDVSDILIFKPPGEDKEVRLRLGSGSFFYATVHLKQLTIESGIQIMSEENNNDDIIASVEEVPVRLTFDLGELIMPFKEIQSLTQGYLIDLNTPVSQAVTIRSLNRVIGTGELVNIDGHMGVRIVKLFSKKTAKSISADDSQGDHG